LRVKSPAPTIEGGQWPCQLRQYANTAKRVCVFRNVALPPIVHCAKPQPLPFLTLSQTRQGLLCGATAPIRAAEQPEASEFRVRGSGLYAEVAMSALLLDYLPLVVFVAVALVIGLVLLIAPFIVAYKQPDPEKLSAYECGFNAFDDARMKFDVRFYLVAILFIIFDLEVAFLFPWTVAFRQIGLFGFWTMMIFLGVLTIGFIYEWKKGALEWD
jgi:NADH-quinone oxidoreductase subunit A